MRRITILIGALSVSAVHAFADVKLKVITDPPGATIYVAPSNTPTNASTYIGLAPGYVQFKTPRRWTACLKSTLIKVRWVSGAEASYQNLLICPAETKNQQIVFVRPDVPGVEVDAQYAAAIMAADASRAPAPPTPTVQYQPPRMPRYCTSQLIGNQVFTRCTGG